MNAWPAFSPDGRKIAFGSSRSGDFEIYAMNADGSDIVRLTQSPGLDARPAWSPDGTRIAFTSNRDGNYEIYVMDTDGSNPHNATSHAAPRRPSHLAPRRPAVPVCFRSRRRLGPLSRFGARGPGYCGAGAGQIKQEPVVRSMATWSGGINS